MSQSWITKSGCNGRFNGNINQLTSLLCVILIAYTVLASINAEAADADDNSPPVELSSLEIIGQAPSRLENIPGSGVIIDKATIDSQGPLSFKDALRTTPGINIVDEDVLGRRLNLGIRGSGSKTFLAHPVIGRRRADTIGALRRSQ